MELSNKKPATLKSKTLGLALAAALLPLTAQANDRSHYQAAPRANLSGTVEVTHQIPGGVITVGAEWGRPKPQVVVVQDRRPDVVGVEMRQSQVVVVGKERGRSHKRNREVTIVREEPRRKVVVVREEPRPQVVVVKTVPARKEVVVVQQAGCGKPVEVVKETRYYGGASHVSIQENRDGRLRNVYVRK
jgi:hypothetical protein